MKMIHPKVFISYSHDSPEHNQWVSDLCVKLQQSEVQVIFDQWDLTASDEPKQFMETAVRNSDWVLVVCTDSYVIKANDGEGGVGYEPMIVTRQQVAKFGINKFIPIIRQMAQADKTPAFLGERACVDFTDDTEFAASFDELLREYFLMPPLQRRSVPHIESLRIKNYRALRDLTLKHLKPLSVFLGANGSGKSTLFDVFAFLAECFTAGLRQAWSKRGGLKELRTRGSEGAIEFEIKYREEPGYPIITYTLSIDEDAEGPFIETETLKWRRGSQGKHVRFLDFSGGKGSLIPGDTPSEDTEQIHERLDEPSILAVNVFGQSGQYPRVGALRRFITDWHLSYLSTEAIREPTEAVRHNRLSKTGNNLPAVIQNLKERYPERLNKIITILSNWVPHFQTVEVESILDGYFSLKIKESPFEKPILAKFAAEGTLKLLSYLTLFHDRLPPQLIGIEEPESYLHPRLLSGLVGECIEVSAVSQLIVTTHSPRFVNELRAEEVWVLYRDEHGFANCKRTSDMPGINEFLETGGKLGQLWMEGYFESGDPLTNAGMPIGDTHAH